MISGRGLRGVAIALLTLALAGCETSGRFGGAGARQAVAPPRAQTFTPAPTGRVETSALPPLAGADAARAPNPELQDLPPSGPGAPPSAQGLPPAGSSVSIDPPPRVAERPPEAPAAANPPPEPNQRVAAIRPEATPPAPSRTSVIGNWTAREASGGSSCRVTLSSSPTLDLYRASSSGCQSRELQRISAWELRGDEIYLYEPGGGVAARLRQRGGGFEGASARTGAPITLAK